MKSKKNYSGINLIIGISFLAPVTYSLSVFEMDAIQRMFFFSVSLLLFIVYLLRYRVETKVLINKPLSILIILFPLTLLTAVFNGSGYLLLLKFSDIIIPFCIMLQTALLLFSVGEVRFFKVCGYSVVIISTLFSIVGILEVFSLKILQLPTIIPPGSTLGNRSFAAEYLLSSLPFFLILNSYIRKEKKVHLFLAAIVNVSFLLFTRNRSGIIILIIVTLTYLIYIFLSNKNHSKLKSSLPVISVIMISFAISFIPVRGSERPDLKSTATTLLDTEFKSNVLRMKFWTASFQMISENPVSGIGIFKWSGYFPKYAGDYFTDENLTYVHNIHAHNDFLEIFAESGFLASSVFLLLYLSGSYSLFMRIKHNQNYFPLLLTFLVTFIYSLVAFPNHKFSSYFLAAISAGTILILHDKNDKNDEKKFGLKFNYLKWLLIILILIGISTSYIRLRSEISYGEAIFLKDRKQYRLMLTKLDEVSNILYPLDASKQPVDYYRGIANYYSGRNSDALKNNLAAAELAPFNPIIIRNVAALYHTMKKPELAIGYYEQLHDCFPNYIDAQINLLYLYSETGQIEKSNNLYDELIKKSPDNPRMIEYKNRYLPE